VFLNPTPLALDRTVPKGKRRDFGDGLRAKIVGSRQSRVPEVPVYLLYKHNGLSKIEEYLEIGMNEREWVKVVLGLVSDRLINTDTSLRVSDAQKLPYASEILSYAKNESNDSRISVYQTDLLVWEKIKDEVWKPRVVVEAKINSVTTHDAITYSQKAATHKQVHPYLRYGILIGNRKHHPLPGRLFRHGAHFDFMMSWQSFSPTENELDDLVELLADEVNSSRNLEEMIYKSRDPLRERYTLLHKPLRIK
jgi:hypothetical protein